MSELDKLIIACRHLINDEKYLRSYDIYALLERAFKDNPSELLELSHQINNIAQVFEYSAKQVENRQHTPGKCDHCDNPVHTKYWENWLCEKCENERSSTAWDEIGEQRMGA